jgi:hypothetical protein
MSRHDIACGSGRKPANVTEIIAVVDGSYGFGPKFYLTKPETKKDQKNETCHRPRHRNDSAPARGA